MFEGGLPRKAANQEPELGSVCFVSFIPFFGGSGAAGAAEMLEKEYLDGNVKYVVFGGLRWGWRFAFCD